jgi:hypothetical protein
MGKCRFGDMYVKKSYIIRKFYIKNILKKEVAVKTIKMTQVNNLTKERYKQGYELVLENAETHLFIASKIAETSNYGIAISHLILSMEELAKAALLKIKSIDDSIEIKNLNKYFHNHFIKQEAMFKLYFASLSDTIKENASKKSSKKSNDSLEVIIILLIGLFLFKDHLNDLNNLFNLNKIRNDGFYVAFDDKNNEWQTPSNVYNEQRYNEIKDFTDQVFDLLKRTLFADKINTGDIYALIEKLSDENILMNKLKTEVKGD